MKMNAIIIDGKKYDYIKDDSVDNAEACTRCELREECAASGSSPFNGSLCRIYKKIGYFRHICNINDNTRENLRFLN